MKLRKVVSLVALLTFLVMLTTSIILYLVPQGRIAYWADWRFMGLSKTQWGNIHINTGTFFLMSLLLHIYYNLNSILAYLKNKSKALTIFTTNFNIALIFSMVVVVGTYIEVPPFSTIISIGDSVKAKAAKKYGEPPYGHAELSSLKKFTSKMKLDLSKCLSLLKDAGIEVRDKDQQIFSIARKNGLSPQKIFAIIKDAKSANAPKKETSKLPEMPEPGLGKRPLSEIIEKYGLDENKVIGGLKKAGYDVTPDMTMKNIANMTNMSPVDIYEILRALPSL